jgi:hypothetical protein
MLNIDCCRAADALLLKAIRALRVEHQANKSHHRRLAGFELIDQFFFSSALRRTLFRRTGHLSELHAIVLSHFAE